MNLNELKEKITILNDVHKTFSEEFYNDFNGDYNLRKMKVREAFEERFYNLSFLDYIENYITNLAAYTSINTVLDGLASNNLGEFRSRIKQKDSILNKLNDYHNRKEKIVEGDLIVQKCLNDLFGCRFIIPNFDYENDLMLKLLCELKEDLPLMHFYYRNRNGYKGLHIYFKNANNHYFPWELQLWNSEDEESNERAHKIHKSKREYISWPKMYEQSERLNLRRKA